MTAVKLLGRIWLPLVILLVLGLGGYAVVRLHGVFGSEKYPTYASGPQTDTKPVNQKQLVYEVFGPEGTVADISYFDAQAQPQQITGAALPWTVTVTSDSPAVVGSVVAQGDNTVALQLAQLANKQHAGLNGQTFNQNLNGIVSDRFDIFSGASLSMARAKTVADDEEDYAAPLWAGVIPVAQIIGAEEPCPRLIPGTKRPGNLSAYRPGRRLDETFVEMQRLYERSGE